MNKIDINDAVLDSLERMKLFESALTANQETKRIYLAAPYATDDKLALKQRVAEATRVAADLMRHGHMVYSPVTHGHAISKFYPGFDGWVEHGESILMRWATDMYILKMAGWQSSEGIKKETATAEEYDIPITYIDP